MTCLSVPSASRFTRGLALVARSGLWAALLFGGTLLGFAQTLYFSNSVPANWSTALGALATSTNHYKAPTGLPSQCLQWNYGMNDTLTITNPGIAAADVTDFYQHTCDLWIYNPSPLSGKKLTFQFLSSNGTAQYYFDFYLDYSGWRRAVRSFKYDMEGPKSSASFNRVRMIGPTNTTGQLFFDAVTWVGPRFTRQRDSQNIDIDGYYSSTNFHHAYYNLTPDIPATPPTPAELADLATLRSAWLAGNAGSVPSASTLNSAYSAWTNMNIVTNGADIRGKVIYGDDTAPYESWVINLGKDVYWRTNANSVGKLNLFLRHWFDQGVDYGSGEAQGGGSGGYDYRQTPSGFILGYPGYDATLKNHVWEMLRWQYRMGRYWTTTWVPGLMAGGTDDSNVFTDDIYLNTRRELGAILFLTPNDATAVQHLKGYRRFNERFLTAVNGTDDGIKVDGCGFHHNSHYNHYMYAFRELSDVLYYLKGTQFQVNSNAYLNLRGALLAMIRMSNTESVANSDQVGYCANSLGGRYPLQSSVIDQIDYNVLRRLGQWGGAVLGQAADPVVAQLYNRVFGSAFPYATFTPYGAEPNPVGFYQFNYSPIGLYRQSNWLATIHGMNNDFWGSEIYATENRYGRYQSYGACEIMYPGGIAGSGWSLSGWDWNRPPGATTIVLPWAELISESTREDVRSALNFAGGLSFHARGDLQGGIFGGFGGLYACNFQEVAAGVNHNSTFVWRKSWFCFSNQIVCLGSDIANNDAANPTVTTLFQGRLTNTALPTVMNGSNVGGFPASVTNNGASANWLLDGYGTGYFIRPGSTVRLDRTAQVSPSHTASGTFTTNNYATAWLNHGNAPSGAGYEYVVVPATTSSAMGTLAADFSNSNTTPYEVLQRNTTAHVVRWKPDGRIGYALFRTNSLVAAVTNAGPLRAVSLPCLVMTQPTNALLWLTLVNPDFNLINNASTPTNVDVTVVGKWSIASGPTNAIILSATASATVVRCQTVHGLPVEVLLAPVGKVTPALAAVTATAIYSGQTLAASSLSGAATNPYTGVSVAGGFGFNSPGIAPNVGATNVSVTFNPVDTAFYTNAAAFVTVTVLPVVTGGTFQWDAFTTTADAQDGTGSWDAATPNWLYGTNNLAWSDHNVAAFGVNTLTNCTVSLVNDVTPAGITFNSTSGTYTLAGTNAIWTTDNPNIIVSNNAVISAPISGVGALTNNVLGSLTLSGTNSYTGLTTVTRGTVNINGNHSAATGGWTLSSGLSGVGMTVSFNSGSSLTVANSSGILLRNSMTSGLSSAALNVAGTVTDHGTLDVNRLGVLTLNSGANWTQNGSMFIRPGNTTSAGASMMVSNAATFTYAAAAPMGISSSSSSSGSARLNIAGTFVTSQGFQNSTTTGTGTSTVTLTNGGVLTLSANVPQLTAGNPASTFLSTGTGSVGGAINTSAHSTTVSNVLTGSGSLTKLGAGTLTLTASNTFTGSLSISNGTVSVNGSLGSGTVAVAPAGTLGGTGTVDTVTVNGMVAPGNGTIGTLTSGGQIWNGGGAYQFSLNSATNNAGWDLLNLAGPLNVQAATNNPFVIKLVSLTSSNTPGPLPDFSSASTNVWTLATVSGGVQNFAPAKFIVDTTGFSNSITGTFTISTNSGSLLLTYAPATLVTPLLSNPVVAPGGTFSFSFSGPEGQGFHVYSTTNLTSPFGSWSVVTYGVFGPSPIIYSETASTNARKFFRVGSP